MEVPWRRFLHHPHSILWLFFFCSVCKRKEFSLLLCASGIFYPETSHISSFLFSNFIMVDLSILGSFCSLLAPCHVGLLLPLAILLQMYFIFFFPWKMSFPSLSLSRRQPHLVLLSLQLLGVCTSSLAPISGLHHRITCLLDLGIFHFLESVPSLLLCCSFKVYLHCSKKQAVFTLQWVAKYGSESLARGMQREAEGAFPHWWSLSLWQLPTLATSHFHCHGELLEPFPTVSLLPESFPAAGIFCHCLSTAWKDSGSGEASGHYTAKNSSIAVGGTASTCRERVLACLDAPKQCLII